MREYKLTEMDLKCLDKVLDFFIEHTTLSELAEQLKDKFVKAKSCTIEMEDE